MGACDEAPISTISVNGNLRRGSFLRTAIIMTRLSFSLRRRLFLALWPLLLAAMIPSHCFARNQDQLLVIVRNGKYGFIDHKGKIVIQPRYVWATSFVDNYGEVYVCGHYVSIDSSGALFPLRLAEKGRLEPERDGKKIGFVDSSGRFKIKAIFDAANPFSGGLAAVRIGSKWGFIDAAGHQVIKPQFKDAFYFREGTAVAESNSGYILIDTSGRVLASGFEYIGEISEGRVPVSRGGMSGYLDLQGKVAIPLIYDSVNSFSGGFAGVEKGDKWGYIDRDGRDVIPFKFDYAGSFASGLAPAKVGAETGFINKTGKFSFYLPFDYAAGFLSGNVATDVSPFWTGDQKFGYVSIFGQVIWGPTDESPDHPPLFDWSEADKAKSCQGVPEALKAKIAAFPPN